MRVYCTISSTTIPLTFPSNSLKDVIANWFRGALGKPIRRAKRKYSIQTANDCEVIPFACFDLLYYEPFLGIIQQSLQVPD